MIENLELVSSSVLHITLKTLLHKEEDVSFTTFVHLLESIKPSKFTEQSMDCVHIVRNPLALCAFLDVV